MPVSASTSQPARPVKLAPMIISPQAGDAPTAVPAFERGHDGAEHRSREDADEAEEDGGVGRGEQLLVPAERDVPGHVAVEADPGDQQGEQRLADGDGRPARDARHARQSPADPLQDAER